MFAIPSPDLLINLFASVGQAIGLLAILLGGTIFARRGSAARLKSAAPSSPWPIRVSVGLLVATVLCFLMYHLDVVDQRNQRLRLNIVRATDFALKGIKDNDFKPMSLEAQEKHPCGVATTQLAQWMQEGRKLNLIDARESEEVEVGHLPGAWHIRYPDLLATEEGVVKEGHETIIYCARGNRGAELASHFTARGYKASFIIGGTEKWLSEDRAFVGLGGKDRTDIRDIPDYPKKNELLETPEVMAMVENEGAVFVDIRYPEEFKSDHLPNAINLTYRRLRNAELEAALSSLPRKPIIAPCYDERSSFFAMVLGLQLTRRGYDFRGRYTLPHEYYVPKIPKAYVAQWRKDQEGRTPIGFVQGSLGGVFAWLQARLSSLAAAIVALVLLLRLVFLPITVKAERDALVQKSLAPRIEELRHRLAGDPGRINRAIMSMYRAERLTPVRNLVGVLVQLVAFLLAFLIVDQAAQGSTEGFAWVRSLGESDATRVLPVLVAGIALALMAWNATRRTALRWVAWLAASAALLALVWGLPAAVNLYLALNMGLMLLQSRVVRAFRARRQNAASHVCAGPAQGSLDGAVQGPAVIPLAAACCSPHAGNKASRLARMKAEGLPVPDGFVVFPVAGASPAVDQELVESAWSRLGATQVAVRSSGVDEDGSGSSHAGEFETVLNVGREAVSRSIDIVGGSLFSNVFAARTGGSVVVQGMVDAEYSGVLFTEDPSCTGCMLVESIAGLCEDLVGGRVTPQAHRFARSNRELLTKGTPPTDMAPLLELGARAEAIFGRPQDIEWAFAGGRFHILQSRDITSTSRHGRGSDAVRERERHRLLELCHGAPADQVVLAQNEVSELLPRPTPFSLAFMDSLWASGGSTDLACREMGIPYDVREESGPFVVGVFGRLYVNRIEERRRLARSPGLVASFQLVRRGETLEQSFRDDFLPAFAQETRRREALDLGKLSEEELIGVLREDRARFVTRTYVQAEVINVTADVLLRAAARKLEKRGLDPAVLLSEMEETVVSRAYSLLGDGDEAGVRDFLRLFGHRANHDFELSEPRYAEAPESVQAIARGIGARAGGGGQAATARRHGSAAAADQAAGLGRVLGIAVDRARRFQVLKEEAKHHCLRELACLRAVVVEIGRRSGLGADVFFLTPDEVENLLDPEFMMTARDLVAERRRAMELFRDLELPTELTVRDLEILGMPGLASAVVEGPGHSGISCGTKVAGDHEVIGPVRIMRSAEDVGGFQDGEILVARFTDPSWLPVFRRARGIVTEVGGWLSHAAIQARERNITAIVGVKDALHSFTTGDIVQLRADGAVQKVADRRRSPRRMVRQGARVEAGGVMVPITVVDQSSTGLSVTGLDAEIGQHLQIEYPEGDRRLHAVVVRSAAGTLGLAFSGLRDGKPIQRPTAVA